MRRISSTFIIAVIMLFSTGCTEAEWRWWETAPVEDQHKVTEHIIREAAAEFGVDGDLMVRVARCESGLRWWAQNSTSTADGLYQFLDTTWEKARFRLYEEGIDPLPYAEWDDFNPRAASRIAAHVVSQGGLSWWNSSRSCWSR